MAEAGGGVRCFAGGVRGGGRGGVGEGELVGWGGVVGCRGDEWLV